ncbi:MAG: hypothetical protein OXF79_27365 [Chloroflexi bacterium]|nr:hypothetical protein [Chloroflexota bacterium]
MGVFAILLVGIGFLLAIGRMSFEGKVVALLLLILVAVLVPQIAAGLVALVLLGE